MSKIYAGVVSFNPDVKRLKQNIEAIASQVDCVVVFENGSDQQRDIIKTIKGVLFLQAGKNLGMAGALNRLLNWGKQNGYEWMISLDQDSVCPNDYVEKMFPFLSAAEKAGIVGPVIIDRHIGIVGHNPKNSWAEVRTCITSGSFNNVEAWTEVGGYDESMFIDSVDFEYCYRLRKNGYKVIQVRDVHLQHELGNSQKRRFLLWKVEVNGHTVFRKYYIARNNVYYPLKHRLWLHFIRGNLRNIRLLVLTVLYEDEKGEKCRAIRKGWIDGIRINTKRSGNNDESIISFTYNEL